jgi:hypothetical protein
MLIYVSKTWATVITMRELLLVFMGAPWRVFIISLVLLNEGLLPTRNRTRNEALWATVKAMTSH